MIRSVSGKLTGLRSSKLCSCYRERLKYRAVPRDIKATTTATKRQPPRERSPPPIKKTRIAATSNASEANELRKKMPKKSASMHELKRKNQCLRTRLSRMKRKLITKSRHQTRCDKLKEAIKSVSAVLTGSARDFFITQIKMSSRNKYGYRWSDEDKAFALTVYHASPKCYRLLAKRFALPSVSLLRRTMAKINITNGFHHSIFEGLRARATTMTEQQKLCCLVFDEMSISERLVYLSKSDKIEGFETIRPNNKTPFVANHACVFMVKGLVEKWKQPVGYEFSSGTLPVDTLQSLVCTCIEKLLAIGLYVKILICDQGSNNQSMIKKLGVTVDSPYTLVAGNRILVMYDPPHLIKSVRNNLHKSGYEVNGKAIEWAYIAKLFYTDSKHNVQLAPKLTKKHIQLPPFAKLRVCFATQVLSHSVAAGISFMCYTGQVDANAKHTAEFIDKFDKLFDVFNSSQLNNACSYKRALLPNKRKTQFLNEMSVWLSRIVKKGTDKSLPCLLGWQLAIACLHLLTEDLFSNYRLKFFLTKRLNQDCLENFFSVIRGKGGFRDNPDPLQFKAAYRDSCVDSMFVKSNASNCKGELDCFFIKITKL